MFIFFEVKINEKCVFRVQGIKNFANVKIIKVQNLNGP